MNPIGTYSFAIQPFEVDFNRNINFALIIHNLLNVAGKHATERGFGIGEINKNCRTWVLSRLAMEMFHYPQSEEKVVVQTWVEKVMRTFVLRNFSISYPSGEILGYVRTIWAMIDTESRKPVNLSGVDNLNELLIDKECPISNIGKIQIPDHSNTSDFMVKYSDLDINKHLNSAKYVEKIIDTFDLQKLENPVKRFEIEYMEECRFGEIITIHKTDTNENESIFILKNEKDDIVCKSKVFF